MRHFGLRWVTALACLFPIGGAQALTVQDAIYYILETNPEIQAAEANKQAIEFELEQARSLRAPRVILEGWAGASRNLGTATPDLSSARSTIDGYELSARVSQMLFDGYQTRSEIERQAYRIDAAAYRVLERSEVLSLEAVRLYSDVLRGQALLALARSNADYHSKMLDRIRNGFDTQVVGLGDLQQAEERLVVARDTVLDFEYNLEDSKLLFLATVGVEPTGLGRVPVLGSAVPATIDAAVATARARSPTIMFAQSDVGSAEALARSVDANQLPTLHLEADGRIGENVGGFEGDRRDARVGLMLRYEFQGKMKRAERQEQARRVNESRAHLLHRTRLVEHEVRQSWSTLQSAQRRLVTIRAQAELSRRLLDSYEREFEVGQRSLLDLLNTQNALFQAEANLINAQSLETYVKYRLLASAGVLLPTLGIEPPEDARAYARDQLGAPPLDSLGDESQFDAGSFRDWRRSVR